MARKASQTRFFECLGFFFARQGRPSIKQIFFQIHCFNGITDNKDLHILYPKPMKFNMYEIMNLTKTFGSVAHIFYSTSEQITLGTT